MSTYSEKLFKKTYERERKKIDLKLSILLVGKKPRSLYVPCSYILNSTGKRLRPFLVLVSAQAVGGDFKDAYNAAVAVEVLHNFTLVHDDIMDNADKRRGKQTLHVKYDLSTAILTGDNLTAIAYEQLLKDCDENDKRVLSTFTKGVIEICEGQSLDQDFETRQSVSIADYKIMILKKTAALVKMCCSVGAQIGRGSVREIKALENYGKNLGMAFQIQDDLLDIIADEKKLGKVIGSDLIEGKKTYLFLRALEKAKSEDKKELIKVIEKRGIRKNQVKKYRDIYVRLGVIDDALNEVKRYTGYALEELDNLYNPEAKLLLLELANALIKRSK